MKKTVIILAIVLAVLLAVLAVCCVLLASGNAASWQEQYDLGNRYLSDGRYEEASIAFLAAIKIDPKRPEAYLGAADAYMGMGDSVSARQILREGLQKTEDPSLQEKLEEVDAQETVTPEQTRPQPEQQQYPEVRVVDAYRDTIGSNTYCFPKIILADGSDAPINGQVYDEMYAVLEEQAYGSNGTWLSEMSYTWGQGNGVVSLNVSAYVKEVDADSNAFYNASTYTGEALSQEAVLQAFNMTQAEFYRQIEARIHLFYDESENAFSQWVNVEDLRRQALAEENLAYSFAYVGEDGALMARIRTYTIAGSGYHIFSFKLQTGTAGGNEAYRSIIEEAMETHSKAAGYGDGYGVLYDVDGNGTDELIMIYDAVKETNGMEFPWTTCSVYTIENGEAVPLLEEEKLVSVAGGPSAQISVVEKDGKAYILAGWETGETADDIIDRYGEWTLYSVSGGEIITETFAEFDVAYGMNGIVYNQSSAIINGANKSYRDLENWVESFDEKVHLEQYSDRNTGVTLEQLLEQLR